jgi:hypothetical protein
MSGAMDTQDAELRERVIDAMVFMMNGQLGRRLFTIAGTRPAEAVEQVMQAAKATTAKQVDFWRKRAAKWKKIAESDRNEQTAVVLERIRSRGHGGGNYRRLIEQELAALTNNKET